MGADTREIAEELAKHRTALSERGGNESLIVRHNVSQPSEVAKVVDVLDAAQVERLAIMVGFDGKE